MERTAPERTTIPGRPDLLPIIAAPPELERDTAAMQSRAPYCGLGFERGRLAPQLHQRILESFRANAGRFRPEPGIPWMGTTEAATIPALFFEDRSLNAEVSQALKPQHEAWSGMALTESACYGIRVYQRGTYLYNHVDRSETHIISSTICVDHQLEKPWPLHIEDIDGGVHQVDMAPGEFLLYEGARLRHGRPYPLDGNYHAGMFVHYRPVDLTVLAAASAQQGLAR